MSIRKSLVNLVLAGAVALGASSKANAETIAYVVKSNNPFGNPMIVLALNDINYSYDIIQDTNIPTTDFSKYDAMLIQDNVNNKEQLPFTSRSSIFLSKDILPYVWSSSSWATSFTFASQFEQLGTPLTEGFDSLSFLAYTSTQQMFYPRIRPSYVHSVALSTGSTGRYGIVSYSDVDGLRDVSFGFNQPDYWTNDTKQLFENSVQYVSQSNPTPEPSTISLLAIAGIGAGVYALRKQKGGIKND